MACQRAVRIVAFTAGLQKDHIVQAVFVNELLHLRRCLLVHLPRDGAIQIPRVGGLLHHVLVGGVQKTGQPVRNDLVIARPVLLGVLPDGAGGDEYPVGGDVGCQHGAVGVVDASALCRHRRLGGELTEHLVLVLLVPAGLQDQDADEQVHECGNHHEPQDPGAAQGM